MKKIFLSNYVARWLSSLRRQVSYALDMSLGCYSNCVNRLSPISLIIAELLYKEQRNTLINFFKSQTKTRPKEVHLGFTTVYEH